MITTTTSAIEGKKITRYLGVVTGEAVIGSNIFEDLFRGLKGIVGGRSNRFEQKLSRARAVALKLLRDNAAELGANAVIGIDLDYEAFSAGEMILMVIASGTAVFVEEGEKK
ncbi:MAG: heavy metal-binding domain-containing protein [candidate division KSB1 bacterium]